MDVSVVIPTLREAGNLPVVVPRIAEALSGRAFEIIVVDDNSRDGTVEVVAELQKQFPVSLIVRTLTDDGLGGAVLTGLSQARGKTLVVMDADLQHPPERIPDLLKEVEQNGAEFVLGSRHVSGASTAENWGLARRINSRVATLLSRPFAGKVRDPMSGFFALPRSVLERAQFLAPWGYKIGLELMCKCRVKKVVEIPIHFATREHGDSKLTTAQQFKYLEHLSRLYDFCYPRFSPASKFVFTVLLAWVISCVVYGLAFSIGATQAIAAVLGYVGAIGSSAVFHARYVRTQREFLPRPTAWRDFVLSSVCELLACTVVASFLVNRITLPMHLELMTIPFAIATFVRYGMRKELLMDIRGLRFTTPPWMERATPRDQQ
jgi:dolichol-phosphate mannosyltransferase